MVQNNKEPAESPSTNSNREAQSASSSSQASANAELAQALKDLARGEQAAAALEANLSTLESKLDEMLAAFGDGEAMDTLEEKSKDPPKSQNGQPEDKAEE